MKLGLIVKRVFNFLPILGIRFYRRCISPLFPPSCRFHPSCSKYALDAFRVYALPKASWLTLWRILRCNPFNPGGYDPLPNDSEKAEGEAQPPETRQTAGDGHA